MKVYYNDSFHGHYPVGTAAVVKAETKEDAARILEVALGAAGLGQTVPPSDMIEVTTPVVIINNGDY